MVLQVSFCKFVTSAWLHCIPRSNQHLEALMSLNSSLYQCFPPPWCIFNGKAYPSQCGVINSRNNPSWCVSEVTTDLSFPRRMQAASDLRFGRYLGADCLGKSDIMPAKNQGEDEAKILARDKLCT